MKALPRLRVLNRLKRFTKHLRAFNIVIVAVAVITLTNICLGVTALVHKDSPNPPAVNSHTAASKSQHTDTKTATTKPVEEASATVPTTDAAAQPVSQQPASSGKLILSTTSLTIAGGDTGAFTVRADNGAKINMPGFAERPPSQMVFNTAASPAKQNWDARLSIGLGLASGTYTVKIFAQDQSARYYYATITVTTAYNPDFTATIEPAYYDPISDTAHFVVRFQTTQGFYAKIDSIDSSITPGGWCAQYGGSPGPTFYIGSGTLDYTCYQPASNTGSISITIHSGGKSHSASTDYTLL